MASNNHFISVSRAGVLVARRKGRAPVSVATRDEGLEVATDDEARARGVPARVQVFFEHGGGNRQLLITAVATPEGRTDVRTFQERFAVEDAALGRWVREAVERALDRAELP